MTDGEVDDDGAGATGDVNNNNNHGDGATGYDNGDDGDGRRRRRRRQQWRRSDGRWDTTTMAADDNKNEVDGNGATGNDDGYVSYYNIQINYISNLSTVYFLPPKAAAAGRANVARDMGGQKCRRTFEGRGGFFSGVL